MDSFYTKQELARMGLAGYGEDVLLSRKASIYSPGRIRLGSHVRIDDFCILSGQISIGNYVHISAGAYLYGGQAGIEIGDFVAVSSRVAVYALTDDYSGAAMTNATVDKAFRNVLEAPVHIGKHVIIGSGCTVLPGVTLEEGCAVGSMSLVNKDVPTFSMVAGVPAKKLRDREHTLLEKEKDFLARKAGNDRERDG